MSPAIPADDKVAGCGSELHAGYAWPFMDGRGESSTGSKVRQAEQHNLCAVNVGHHAPSWSDDCIMNAVTMTMGLFKQLVQFISCHIQAADQARTRFCSPHQPPGRRCGP